jgi:dTDP-4-dehydrorhamnose 3,5-epimerase-like enzyme
MNKEKEMPHLIQGGLAVDDRGQVVFVNDFDFKGVKRFYSVSNHASNFVRAWHAHKKEAKYVLVTQGAAIIGAVEVDNWDDPSKDTEVHRFVLAAQKPSVLYIPAGYANGFMTLTEDTQLMFFSTSSLEESKGDDFRYEARHWHIWGVTER